MLHQFVYLVAVFAAVLLLSLVQHRASELTRKISESESTSLTQLRLGKRTTLDSHPPPSAPGGFKVQGTCDLERIRERKEKADLGIFVKHGIHVMQRIFPGRCRAVLRGHRLGLRPEEGKTMYPTWTVEQFVNSTREHKLLAVRGQASFYKSAFNHVCNKGRKRGWRRENGVDCKEKGSFMKLLQLDEKEISMDKNPFLLKELVLASEELKKVMLVDYTCIPNVVASLCGETLVEFEEMSGKRTNSVEGQNYTDYWSMHNYTSFAPFNPFWDYIYEELHEKCCLELVKE